MIPCELVNVKSLADFKAALIDAEFDLIISDYTLPAYDGMSALAFARTVRPDAPFLFVSGTIGADRAATSLKSGATDIVFKDHWEHLAPAVRNALREARRHIQGRRVGGAAHPGASGNCPRSTDGPRPQNI